MTRLLRAAALACLFGIAAAPASAQDYPSRTVKLIVPFGAGGPADVFARDVAQHLSEQMKQPFVVENRPGAGSIIGTDAVAKSAPDGYTLLVMSNTHTTNESLIAEQAVPADARLRAGRADQLLRPADGHSPVGAGEGPEGVHRARQGEAGQAQLRVVRAGHAVSHGGRAVQSDERHQHRARAAQGLGRSAQQRDRRPRADDVRRHHHDGGERAGRAGARARHDRD